MWHVNFIVSKKPSADLVRFAPNYYYSDPAAFRIEEFQKKLQEVRLEANLEQAVIQECIKVQNRLGLNLNFYEKFSKIWDSLGIRDR